MEKLLNKLGLYTREQYLEMKKYNERLRKENDWLSTRLEAEFNISNILRKKISILRANKGEEK